MRSIDIANNNSCLLILLLDINECKWNLHDCDDLCFNSPGSYECGCRKGCELDHDNKTCNG